MISKCKTSDDLELIRRLRAAGCPVPGNEIEPPQADLTVEVLSRLVTIAYDQRAGSEYVFNVRISNTSYRALTIEEVRGRTPWGTRLAWLRDLGEYFRDPLYYYRFPSGRTFPYQDVINHRVCGKEFSPGAGLEGLLLGHSTSRIPSLMWHLQTASSSIFLTDQFGRKHRSQIDMIVDCTAMMPVPNARRTSLYDEEERSRMEDAKIEARGSQVRVVATHDGQSETEPESIDDSRPEDLANSQT